MSAESVPLPREDLVHAAYALLAAAIPALRNRVDVYQDAFCLLPEDVQAEARALIGVEWGGKP